MKQEEERSIHQFTLREFVLLITVLCASLSVVAAAAADPTHVAFGLILIVVSAALTILAIELKRKLEGADDQPDDRPESNPFRSHENRPRGM